MAKFTSRNIEFKDNQKAIFGTADGSSIYWDGSQLVISTVVSGVEPVLDNHLTTKQYVDTAISTISGLDLRGNIDGGRSDSVYGGITSIDGGTASTIF